MREATGESRLAGPAAARTRLRLFASGFLALLPLWTAAVPSGLAFGVAARDAGLSAASVQLMSVTVFSAAGQFAALAQIEAGSSTLALAGTVLALNVQLLLIGVAIQRQLRLSWPERVAVAALLTDGAYGIAAARERLLLPVLLGAGASMFAGWNFGTALGIAAGRVIDTGRIGLGLVVPLAFLAVLVPLLRSRAHLAAALVAGGAALVAGRALPPGAVILAAGLVGALAGAALQSVAPLPAVDQDEPG